MSVSDLYPRILHSGRDQPSIVIADSVYMGYRLALALVLSTEAFPCGAWR